MEHLLIVFGILLLCSAIGGVFLPKIPTIPLAFGAVVLLLFNSRARGQMAEGNYIVFILLALAVLAIWFVGRKKNADGSREGLSKLVNGSIFQIIAIMVMATYFTVVFFV